MEGSQTGLSLRLTVESFGGGIRLLPQHKDREEKAAISLHCQELRVLRHFFQALNMVAGQQTKANSTLYIYVKSVINRLFKPQILYTSPMNTVILLSALFLPFFPLISLWVLKGQGSGWGWWFGGGEREKVFGFSFSILPTPLVLRDLSLSDLPLHFTPVSSR